MSELGEEWFHQGGQTAQSFATRLFELMRSRPECEAATKGHGVEYACVILTRKSTWRWPNYSTGKLN